MTKRLEDIGFYTLSDKRAREVHETSPLSRCELILTDRCNFSCPYCRGGHGLGEMGYGQAEAVVRAWAADGLSAVRFSGGEPTLWPGLARLVQTAREDGIARIAVSTNGSAGIDFYRELAAAGVNDFSVSLDACCAATGAVMAGRDGKTWEKVVENIRELAAMTYVTVGIVVTDDNLGETAGTVALASSLGVTDIRIIPAAQQGGFLKSGEIPESTLAKHPILAYRIGNMEAGRPVRGIPDGHPGRCPLVLDDMVVTVAGHHPCVIHMREGGPPIGTVDKPMEDIRKERVAWFRENDPRRDPICKANCLDVCVDHAMAWAAFRKD